MRISANLLVLVLALAGAEARRTFQPTAAAALSSSYTLHSHISHTATIVDNDIVGLSREYLRNTYPSVQLQEHGDSYKDADGYGYVYFTQLINGIPVNNARANVNIGADGRVFSAGSSLITGEALQSFLSQHQSNFTRRAEPLSARTALGKAAESLRLPLDLSGSAQDSDNADGIISGVTAKSGPELLTPPTAVQVLYATATGDITFVWKLGVHTAENQLTIYVDLETGVVLEASDSVLEFAPSSYMVYNLGLASPLEGERTLETGPWHKGSSPFGYHSLTGKDNTTILSGNNANLVLPSPGPSSLTLNFNYPKGSTEASATQLFYMANNLHDYFALLGFTPAAGNFEATGGDALSLTVSDPSLKNNAIYSGGIDGMPAGIKTGLWTVGSSTRDSALDNGVVAHELTHGVSTRLVGGPSKSDCLIGTLEAAGLGEGYSDFIALVLRLKAKDTAKAAYNLGEYLTADRKGVRQYPYSTNLTVNPLKFSDTTKAFSAHTVGEIWATVLYEVLWAIITKRGGLELPLKPAYIANPFPGGVPVPAGGRNYAVKLVFESLQLVGCRPGLLAARDALVDAEMRKTHGTYKCEIWQAFAKRGFGTKAKVEENVWTDSYDMPACS